MPAEKKRNTPTTPIPTLAFLFVIRAKLVTMAQNSQNSTQAAQKSPKLLLLLRRNKEEDTEV